MRGKSFGYADFMYLMRALAFSIMLGSFNAWAQPAPGGAASKPQGYDAPVEFGFHLGNLLPNQISGVTEIMGLGGARAGFRINPEQYLEGGFITGNGEGVQWKNVHIDIRMDVPVENLVAVAYVGADAVYFQGSGHGDKLIFGGHAGGGLMGHLSGSAWWRGDMKFGFSPGTSLYIGVGLEFRLGSGGT